MFQLSIIERKVDTFLPAGIFYGNRRKPRVILVEIVRDKRAEPERTDCGIHEKPQFMIVNTAACNETCSTRSMDQRAYVRFLIVR